MSNDAVYNTFKDDLKAKELTYPDSFIELKGERIIPSDSFSHTEYEALKSVQSFKTNNYSNLFLLKKQKNSDWLSANVKEHDAEMGIVSTLSFISSDIAGRKAGKFLYFSKNYEFWDINLKYVDYVITDGRPESGYLNYVFYIEFLDDFRCRISHTFGDLKFYLAVEQDKTIHFVKDISRYEVSAQQSLDDVDFDNALFFYNIDDQLMTLYKPAIITKSVNEEGDITEVEKKQFVIGYDNGKLTLDDVDKIDDQNHKIYVTNNILDFDFYINSSWVSYDRSQYIDSINEKKSKMNIESQTLLHHQYNADDGVNFIPLKNDMTYKGNIIRGDNFSFSSNEVPDVNFRNYTSIHSGINQERGTDNIILSYTFHDQVYEIEQGEDLIFTIDESREGELNPLFPYSQINIKDTKFVKNGAFASSSPAFADKFKKKQDYHQQTSSSVNNAQYLCTWLYAPNEASEPVWLDRWYYPDFISRPDALRENIIDDVYLTQEAEEELGSSIYQQLKDDIKQRTYFDKLSDVVIEPGCTYTYSRVSDDMIREMNDKMSSRKVDEYYDQNGKSVDGESKLSLNGENWRKIKYNQLNKTNQLNINFDIYLDQRKKMSAQLFGCDYTAGFNIQNRKDLTPYLYYATDDAIFMLNNKYKVKHSFNLKEKYNDRIVKFLQGDTFNDVIIVSTAYLYILSYDLRLKSKISLIDDSNILDIKEVAFKGEQSVVNYPYGLNSLTIENVSFEGSTVEDIEDYDESVSIERPSYVSYRSIGSVKDEGSYPVPSLLAELISKENAVMYNSNLYVPFFQRILKIIFTPDSEYDNFSTEDRKRYIAKARLLNDDEYSLNYLKLSDSANDEETIGTESGNIEVSNRVKHILFDKNGHAYGFNFEDISLSSDCDTVYGLYAFDRYIAIGGSWWLFNQSLSKMRADAQTSKYAEFESPNSIDRVRLNQRGEMSLVRCFNNLPENQLKDNYKRIEIFGKDKQKKYEYNLSDYEEVYCLDAYQYINEALEEKSVFALIGKKLDSIYVVIYDCDSHKFTEQWIDVPATPNERYFESVNTNAQMRYEDDNSLYFNLYFPSAYLYPHLATIEWSLKDLQTGWYNINVTIDLDQAIFQVKINDIVYKTVNMNTNEWFEPYINSNGTLFSNTYYIGCLGKKYGTTLNNILENGIYDPYVAKNTDIENFVIHTKTLSYAEYQALRMRNSKINALFITVPCGIRNNIEEIVRYFRYNAPGAISNKVKINIAGTGLQTIEEYDLLKKEIMKTINENKDCLVEVEDIEFIS